MNMHHIESFDVCAQPARQRIRILESFAALAGEEDRKHSPVIDRTPHHYRQAGLAIGIRRCDQQLNALFLERPAHLQDGLARPPVSRSDRRNDMQDTYFVVDGHSGAGVERIVLNSSSFRQRIRSRAPGEERS